ncbi:MAG: hypothetical protein KF799_14420 [Bdellovibrionales bacterium]|nr:hypothetical protein [Bdellovibrionales bacterium]
MTLFDIPVGFASVFMMILIGYFVLTVWFGAPQAPVVAVQKTQAPLDEATPAQSELAG